jgi:hypothetical protein
VNGTEHVIVGEEVVKAQILDCRPDPPNSGRIPSKLGLRVDDADLHGSASHRQRSLHGGACDRFVRSAPAQITPDYVPVYRARHGCGVACRTGGGVLDRAANSERSSVADDGSGERVLSRPVR